MPSKIKVAIATHAGGAHLGAYYSALRATQEVESVAFADPSGKYHKAAAKALGSRLAKSYKDVGTMLKEFRPAMTIVTMEAAKAPPVIAQVLESGSHVFAEKPACVKTADFERLTKLADAKHRYLMLALANRRNSEAMFARKLIADGALGKLYAVDLQLVADQTRLTRKSYQNAWFTKKARAGGGFLSWLAIHWLDLAEYLTGLHVEQVAGFTANVGGQPVDIEDSIAAGLRYEKNVLGTLSAGYFLDRGYHSQIKIWGAHGWLRLQQMEASPLEWYTTKGTNKGKVQTWKGSKQPRGYTPFVRECVRAAAGLRKPPISNAESLQAVRVVYSIYDAAATGKVAKV